MQTACVDFYLLYLAVLVAIDEAAAAEAACVAAGGNPGVCHQQYRKALLKADSDHGVAKEKLATKVAGEVQAALDTYFSCLLACDCIEDEVKK